MYIKSLIINKCTNESDLEKTLKFKVWYLLIQKEFCAKFLNHIIDASQFRLASMKFQISDQKNNCGKLTGKFDQ